MPFQCFGKLSQKKEPERGSLSRFSAVAAPKNSTPILSLPPEVRACIFKFLIDDVKLTFKCTTKFDVFTCWASWPDFHKNLSFLKACQLFEAEAVDLVKVRTAMIEVEQLSFNSRGQKPGYLTGHQGLPPQMLPMRFERVRSHLTELRLDSGFGLEQMLLNDVLSSFPKLRIIQFKQTLAPRKFGHNFRERLNDQTYRAQLLHASLREPAVDRHSEIVHQLPYDNGSNAIQLRRLLSHPKLHHYHPVLVETVIRSVESNVSYLDDDIPTFPILKEVSAVRMTYKAYAWPKAHIIDMEVDMYQQPMQLAIKSQWTEKVDLTKHLGKQCSGLMVNRTTSDNAIPVG